MRASRRDGPRRRRPRPAADAVRAIVANRAPQTLLAAVQTAWLSAVGRGIAAEAQPVGERDGTITVSCRSATWAQELDLMQDRIRERLNAELGEGRVTALRFRADAARHGL